jgi:hypothetical protein
MRKSRACRRALVGCGPHWGLQYLLRLVASIEWRIRCFKSVILRHVVYAVLFQGMLKTVDGRWFLALKDSCGSVHY